MFTVKLKCFVSYEKTVMYLKRIVDLKWIFCTAWVCVCVIWLEGCAEMRACLCLRICVSCQIRVGIWDVFVWGVEMSIESEMWKRIRTRVMLSNRHVLIVSPCSSQSVHLIAVNSTLLNKYTGLSKHSFYKTSANIHTLDIRQPKMFSLNHFIHKKYDMSFKNKHLCIVITLFEVLNNVLRKINLLL